MRIRFLETIFSICWRMVIDVKIKYHIIIMGSNQSKPIDSENRILLKLGNQWIDATEFIDQHPGGAQAILNKRDHDITKDYSFHSQSAKKMIDSMIIK